MNKLMYLAIIALVFTTSAFKLAKDAYQWTVKENSYSVKFTSKKFDGIFKGLNSELIFDENNLSASKLNASIDANTINTGNGMRNKHAKQGLDVAKFPSIKFASTSIVKTSSGYETTGNMTIKGVTKSVKIPFTFSKTADGGVFVGTFSIKPSDYNVTKSGTPEQLNFNLNIPVTK